MDNNNRKEVSGSSIENSANELKLKGNELYLTGKYHEAINYYDEAILLDPKNPIYYGNKSACCIMLGQYTVGHHAARKSIELDNLYEKGHLRNLKCNILLGNIHEATSAYNAAFDLGLFDENNGTNEFCIQKQNLEILKNETNTANEEYKNSRFHNALVAIEKALSIAKGCINLKIMRARLLIHYKRIIEADKLLNEIFDNNRLNMDVQYIRALCYYYMDNIDKAMIGLQTALKLDSNHRKATILYEKVKKLKFHRTAGNTAYYAKAYHVAIQQYTKCLEIDSTNHITNSHLLCNRAAAYFESKNYHYANMDCFESLKLDRNNVKALYRKAKVYLAMQEYECAINVYEQIFSLHPTDENKRYLDGAKKMRGKSAMETEFSDYYSILGVKRESTDEEIKKAYKKRALEYHPDRHGNSTDEMKKELEQKFKLLGHAYTILSDSTKKSQYDVKYDQKLGKNKTHLYSTLYKGFGIYRTSNWRNV